jgi:hypothetical protein
MGGTLTGTLTAADFRVGGQNTIATFERAVVALLTGNTYLNFHTADNPSGEVRGQVGPLGFAVPLSGAQEAPPAGPVDTPGNGTATLTLNAAQDTMTYTLSYAQLATNVTQAHIHVGPRGENGPVVLFLCGDTPPAGVMTPICPDAPGTDRVTVSGAVGMADLRPNDLGITALREVIDNLIAGNTYVNAHTVTFPGGEIRGQID